MPASGQLYIALPSQTFKQHICAWLGSIHNYYVLKSKSLNKPLKNSNPQNVQEIVHNSKEERREQEREKYYLKEVKICIRRTVAKVQEITLNPTRTYSTSKIASK